MNGTITLNPVGAYALIKQRLAAANIHNTHTAKFGGVNLMLFPVDRTIEDLASLLDAFGIDTHPNSINTCLIVDNIDINPVS